MTTHDETDPAAFIPELMVEYAEAGDPEAVAELARLASDPAALAEVLGTEPPKP